MIHTQPAGHPGRDIDHKVLQAQVAALYGTMLGSTIADAALAWSLSALFYWRLQDPMVLVWLGLHTVQMLFYPVVGAYFSDPAAASRGAFWARRYTGKTLIYSLTWGLAPWLFMPRDDVPLTVLLMLCVIGLSTGGVPSVAPRWHAALAFVLPMVLGLITALLWQGGTFHLFMAGCTTIYLGATMFFAHSQHRLLTQALVTGFEKEELAERLAQQNELSQRASDEKTRFLAAASHDLRQPLHAIALFGAVLEKSLQGQTSHPHAARLMRAVHALGGSLDTMLDVSRLDAGTVVPQVQPLALDDVFVSLHQTFSPLAEEKGLQLRLRSTPLRVLSDPQLLQRLLANLLDNAIKYTERGGVLVRARARGSSVWVEVVDTGIGIPVEHAERVFDEFYQVNNAGRDRSRGLGIGLSIVQRLARLLDHPVHLMSKPGHGSRLRVVLPAAEAASAPPAEIQVHTPAPEPPTMEAAWPRRVLLVDDEADIAEAATALLGAWGIALVAAPDEDGAARALQHAHDSQQPFDALICDVRLSGGADGLDAAARLRTRFDPGLPLLLVTGETAPQRLQRVRDAGVPVLFKPVPAERLLQALQALRPG